MKLSNTAVIKLEHNIVTDIEKGHEASLRWILESLKDLSLKVVWCLGKDQRQTIAVMPDDFQFNRNKIICENDIYLNENNQVVGAGSVLLGFEKSERIDRPSVEPMQG